MGVGCGEDDGLVSSSPRKPKEKISGEQGAVMKVIEEKPSPSSSGPQIQTSQIDLSKREVVLMKLQRHLIRPPFRFVDPLLHLSSLLNVSQNQSNHAAIPPFLFPILILFPLTSFSFLFSSPLTEKFMLFVMQWMVTPIQDTILKSLFLPSINFLLAMVSFFLAKT